MMVKKILHILTGLARGGCEVNSLSLIEQTPECQHEVLVLGQDREMIADFTAAGAVLHYHCPVSRLPWKLSKQIRQCIGGIRPDGVIIWHGMVMLPQILHALREHSIPVLVHGGNPAHSMPARVDWRYWLLEKMLGRRAAATYVCCSRYVADSFAGSRYLRRFPRKVVPNGIRPVSTQLGEMRRGSHSESITLGMVARLDSIKDHATLLRAFALLLKDHSQVRLELAGDGDLRSQLERLAQDLGVTAQTHFLGQVPDPYEVMRNWDLFVYATTEREGLGNALAEAMMMGLPCVATDIGPIAELAGSSPVAVQLVPARDPLAMAEGISELLLNPTQRDSLSLAGQARARAEFSADVFAHRYLELLQGGLS